MSEEVIFEEIKVRYKFFLKRNFIVRFIHIRHLIVLTVCSFFMEPAPGKSKGEGGSFAPTAGRLFLPSEAARETCGEKQRIALNTTAGQ